MRRELGLDEFDLSDVLSRRRELTQRIARWAYEGGFQAVMYPSRFVAGSTCWAIFGSARLVPGTIGHITVDDAASVS